MPGSLVGDEPPRPEELPTPSPPALHWIRRFLAIEAAAGILLLGATVVALAWANSPWQDSYGDVWSEDLRHWVNDGLMSVFFFVVGLEIKREVTRGDLGTRRAAALPAVAALGGMVVPTALYAVLNVSGEGARGWGIPMATDIAFAVSLMAAVGRRAPHGLKVLLLSLAVLDDIGAILVITFFYTGEFALAEHVTIIAVALGLLVPARWGERLEAALHPWTAYVVVPVFVLANAGVEISSDVLGDAAASRVTLGVALALVVGKFVGIAGAAWIAVRAGVADLPENVTWRHVRGMAALAGIGFTVSLFITGLAFDDAALQDQAKLGVLVGSALAAIIGTLILLRAPSAPGPESAGPPTRDGG